MKKVLATAAVFSLFIGAGSISAATLTDVETLGKLIYESPLLSWDNTQSCATCHSGAVGYADDTAVSLGDDLVSTGGRNAPTSAYAGFSPLLHLNQAGEWVGGMFWDGRATGWTLGDPLAEQALGPFLSPLEQNNASPQVVVDKVKASSYKDLFAEVCAANEGMDPYEVIGRSIAAYERSAEVSPFTSKYDYWLKGKARLTGQERLGLALFKGKAMCSACHISEPGMDGSPPLFTDFTYDNLGIPRNPLNPFYNEPDWNPDGENWVDTGLGGFLQAAGYDATVWGPEWGKQKVPTLRNVDRRPSMFFVKAYGHNGYFKSLYSIVHFYNARDVAWANWPDPEVPVNVNDQELGNLRLTVGEEIAIVAFLRTLSDGYVPASAH